MNTPSGSDAITPVAGVAPRDALSRLSRYAAPQIGSSIRAFAASMQAPLYFGDSRRTAGGQSNGFTEKE